jgi:pantetheine-phosphate adenylyltransferase
MSLPCGDGARPLRAAVYPGSFDPVTCGHLDVIRRGSLLFDRLHVAVSPVSSNPEKSPLFTADERVAMLRSVTAELGNVEVDELHGLLVEYAAGRGAQVILKGLRAVSDFEFEYAMALMNRRLRPEIDAFFVMTSAEYSYLSSSLVKEVARLGGALDGLVPEPVAGELRRKFRRRQAAGVPDGQVADRA